MKFQRMGQIFRGANIRKAIFLSSDTYIAIDIPADSFESKEDTFEGSGDISRYPSKAFKIELAELFDFQEPGSNTE